MATHDAIRMRWSTIADTMAEVEAVGDRGGDAHALDYTG